MKGTLRCIKKCYKKLHEGSVDRRTVLTSHADVAFSVSRSKVGDRERDFGVADQDSAPTDRAFMRG